MEKHIPFRLMALFALLALAIALFSCQDDDQNDLSGTWNFIEPPHPLSRVHRGEDPTPVFDVIFTIKGNQVTDVDLVVFGEFIDGESGYLEGNTLIIEGGGLTLTINGLRQVGGTLQSTGVLGVLNGDEKTFGALQIEPY